MLHIYTTCIHILHQALLLNRIWDQTIPVKVRIGGRFKSVLTFATVPSQSASGAASESSSNIGGMLHEPSASQALGNSHSASGAAVTGSKTLPDRLSSKTPKTISTPNPHSFIVGSGSRLQRQSIQQQQVQQLQVQQQKQQEKMQPMPPGRRVTSKLSKYKS
jgi:hypothetical protein